MHIQWLELGLIVGSLLSATIAFIYLAVKISRHSGGNSQVDFQVAAKAMAENIFDNDFREELKNRGRLNFEKIINENAMFLQQDLRLTSSEINQHMKSEITKNLQEAFSKYEQSINDAKQIALDSMKKTEDAVEQQRRVMSDQLQTEIDRQKQRIIENFNKNMSNIINHYVLQAVGNQINLDDQLEYILAELDRNKADILEDIKRGS